MFLPKFPSFLISTLNKINDLSRVKTTCHVSCLVLSPLSPCHALSLLSLLRFTASALDLDTSCRPVPLKISLRRIWCNSSPYSPYIICGVYHVYIIYHNIHIIHILCLYIYINKHVYIYTGICDESTKRGKHTQTYTRRHFPKICKLCKLSWIQDSRFKILGETSWIQAL